MNAQLHERQQTAGRVLSAQHEQREFDGDPISHHESERRTYYHPVIRYEYTVEGKRYKSGSLFIATVGLYGLVSNTYWQVPADELRGESYIELLRWIGRAMLMAYGLMVVAGFPARPAQNSWRHHGRRRLRRDRNVGELNRARPPEYADVQQPSVRRIAMDRFRFRSHRPYRSRDWHSEGADSSVIEPTFAQKVF